MIVSVPFVDLRAQYESMRAEIDRSIDTVIDSCEFAGGAFVRAFEEKFADYCSAKEGIGVGSGTEALWLILRAMGIGPEDEVITVANTFVATVEAIRMTGAAPVFVDIDPNTYTMDPLLLESAITPRTRAIIPVHLYGQTANMNPIMQAARTHHLYVVEDACQAHGAEFKGSRAGSIGDAAAFSFYPTKNLGAYGDAGAVTTNNVALADTIRMLRDHGQSSKYQHQLVGWNCRMDGIQAAILNAKLKHLENWTAARRCHADRYRRLLTGLRQVVPPTEAEYARHVYHLFVVRVPERDMVFRELANRGIQCGIHYPAPLHQQAPYRTSRSVHDGCTVATSYAAEILSLPMFPELTVAHIERVVEELSSILERRSTANANSSLRRGN